MRELIGSFKRSLCLLVSFVLVVGMIPLAAYAQQSGEDGLTPKAEIDLASDDFEIAQVVMGLGHSSAITSDGSLWMWGHNDFGQLGDGTYEEHPSPPVKAMEGVSQVALGVDCTAALRADGSLWMWGWNDCGQLGDGTYEEHLSPFKVMEGVSQVALGGGFPAGYTAALKDDGSLWMWGRNDCSQLGDGTTEDRYSPVKVMEGVSQVEVPPCNCDAGFTAALKDDGSLWMWGRNDRGQLGDGTTEDRHSPVKVMEEVSQVALGSGCTAALKGDGSLWMWGHNVFGQLGDGTTEDRHSPVKVMEGVSQVALGVDCTAALRADGSLWMWGRSDRGQLGDGTTEDRHSPFKVMEGVSQVALGGGFPTGYTAALRDDGSLWMWGRNDCGQLGDGTTEDCHSPVKVMEGVSQVALGDGFTAALKADGSLWMWGCLWFDGYTTTPVCIFRDGEWLSGDDPVVIDDPIPGDFTTTYEVAKDVIVPRIFSDDEGFVYKDSYFYGPATEYNHSLATMSLCMAFSAYGMEPYDKYDKNVKELMEKCGFADGDRYRQYSFNEVPTETSIGCAIGSKIIEVDEEDVTLIAVAVRGGGYEDEWSSNFEVGLSGDHSGFNWAAYLVTTHIKDYIEKHHIDGNVKIWITGFSRGAAVATQTAARLNDMSGYAYEDDSGNRQVSFDKNSVYAYGFATPAGACKASNPHSKAYSNIWNIIEYNDPVPLLAPGEWGFDRYGTTKILPYRESNNAKTHKAYFDRMRSRLNGGYGYNIEGFTNYLRVSYLDYTPYPRISYQIVPNLLNHDTQGTFLRKLVRAAVDAIGDREKYCNKHQYTVQAFMEELLGGENKGHSLKSYDYEVFMFLIDTIPELYILHPHLTETLLKNTSTLIEVHADQDYYLGWMQLMDGNYENSLPLKWGDSSYRVFKSNCPVDMYVYDANGEIVASIVDEEPSASEDQPIIVSIDENGQKVAYLPNDGDYRVEVVAREDCDVSCGIEEVNAEHGDAVRATNFETTELSLGEGMEAEIPAILDEEMDAAANDGSSAQYSMYLDGSGVEIASDLCGAEAIAEHTYNVSVSFDEEQGEVYGGGSFVEGSFARLEAVGNEQYVFDGYYIDGVKCESTDDGDANTIRFKVTKDTQVEARFEKKPTVAIPKPATGLVYTGGVRTGVAAGEGYTVEGGTATNAGTYTATVTLSAGYIWADGTSEPLKVKWTIKPAANKVTAKKTVVKKSLQAKKLQKKGATITLPKVTSTFGKAKWVIAKSDKKKVLSVKNGKVRVKKGAKKGTYIIKLKASVAGTKNYTAAKSKTVTVKVTIN